MSKPEPTKGSFAHLKATMPPEKFAVKAKRTVLGIGIAALGAWVVYIGAKAGPSLPLVFLGVGLCLLGAQVWSGELVLSPFKSFGDVVVGWYRKATGKNGTP